MTVVVCCQSGLPQRQPRCELRRNLSSSDYDFGLTLNVIIGPDERDVDSLPSSDIDYTAEIERGIERFRMGRVPTRCALSIKMTWDPSECPPSDVCREYYCCHWVEPRGSVDLTGRTYDSIEEAITVRRD